MSRERITIETTGGHKVTVNSFLTGRESTDLKSVLFGGISVVAEAGAKPTIPLANTIEHERATLQKLIVQFDDVVDTPFAAFEDLPSEEYEEAVAQIKEKTRVFLGQKK